MKRLKVNMLSFGGLALFFLLATASSEEAKKEMEEEVQEQKVIEQKKVEAAPAIEVSAADLCKEYEANEVAADEKYKDKVVLVSGKVENIGKDLMDEMYVALKSGKKFDMMAAQAFFPDNSKNQIAALKKGNQITVKCRCEGKMMNVLLKDCSLQPSSPDA